MVAVMAMATVAVMEVQPHKVTSLSLKKYERNAHIF